MSIERTLPSGLVGTIRELGVKEENILSNPRHARSGRSLHQVFESCWVDTIDPGIYNFPPEGFSTGVLLQGDGMVLLIFLRIESHGPQYLFDVNCPQCGERIPWELDLNEYVEMNFKPLSTESKKVILEENGQFKGKFPKCGLDYTFRLLTLKDELRFPQIKRQHSDKMSSALLNAAITNIDGIEHRRAFLGLEDYPRGFEGEKLVLSMADAHAIRQHMDEINCGLETTFHVECSTHGEVAVELPFRDDFLLPKKRIS